MGVGRKIVRDEINMVKKSTLFIAGILVVGAVVAFALLPQPVSPTPTTTTTQPSITTTTILTGTTISTTTTTVCVFQCSSWSDCTKGSKSRICEDGCSTRYTEIQSCEDLCPTDLMQCPNGVYVRRDTKNDCEFYPCSTDTTVTVLITSIQGDKVKLFNNEGVMIKSQDISFNLNGGGIICSGFRDFEPYKYMECTLEARCQAGDVLTITYPGRSISYNC